MAQRERNTADAEETVALGREIGLALAAVRPPARVALHGPLGSGKTWLAKGLFAAFGVEPDRVKSPSFSLVNEYGDGLRHLDLYRLENEADLLRLGVAELAEEGRLIVIEWAQRFDPFAAWGLDSLRIELAYGEGGVGRRFGLTPRGEEYERAVATLYGVADDAGRSR